MSKPTFYRLFGKRAFDLFFSGLLLLLLAPLMLILAGCVRFKLGSPVIFKQTRPGKNEQLFFMYKFRTMTDEKDQHGAYLPDEVRLTKFGKLLRATSLDELPELWNIFKGEMSFVGPRPLLVEYLTLYNEEQRKRHNIRPGLTGLAQVSGRNAISWEEKFTYDCLYVESYSFGKDVWILLQTVLKVFKQEGISSNFGPISEKFEGNEPY
ncbi:sugar transferase [Enterococcus hirae]|uniref:sugar transferase n=1 Tax=Enterococcus hirae TaxID=1354 RepID=UPI00391CB80B